MSDIFQKGFDFFSDSELPFPASSPRPAAVNPVPLPPKKGSPVSEEFKDSESSARCYLVKKGPDYFVVTAFQGRRQKPDFRYRYSSREKAMYKIWSFFESVQLREQHAKETKERRKAEAAATFAAVKIGSIFVASWGYDQTNVDAYQVIEKKGKSTVVVRRIYTERIEGSEGAMSCKVKPDPGAFHVESPALTRRLGPWGLAIDSSRQARLWDGSREFYCSWYH
jgi:hypothetical protein